METTITKIAMDTHKKQHHVAWAHPETGEIQVFTVNNTVKDITKMVKKLSKQASGPLHFCYEAGVCGFTLKRRIENLGSRCSVIAPSLVPTAKGDRIKTDRRDAKKLLGQFIAGTLTEVYPPSAEQEAAREITRCRQAAQEDLKCSRHRLLKFLTRHGYLYHEGRHWTTRLTNGYSLCRSISRTSARSSICITPKSSMTCSDWQAWINVWPRWPSERSTARGSACCVAFGASIR